MVPLDRAAGFIGSVLGEPSGAKERAFSVNAFMAKPDSALLARYERHLASIGSIEHVSLHVVRELGVANFEAGAGMTAGASAWPREHRAELRASGLVHGAAGATPLGEPGVLASTLEGMESSRSAVVA
jgi:hypothetical protein